MIFVDSHCHLNKLDNPEYAIKKATKADVKYMQTICTNLDEFEELKNLANNYDSIFTSVGIHPDDVKSKHLKYQDLIALAQHPKVIGFGETGLDYYRSIEYKNEQIYSFEQHIIACQETGLPSIIHTRNASDDTLKIINSFNKQKEFKILIHCFTESLDFASKILDMGGYISISGIVTFKNAQALRDVVKFIPIDRLLIETDSPYLAPLPMRGKVNEPSFVKYVAEHIATLKDLSIDVVAKQTTNNFFNIFSKASRV
jgi:TatD DNase family protein